jgi:HAD superfamily hydrolase (TIGR01509 family)
MAERPRAVLLDAGFTLTFPHVGLIAEYAASAGIGVSAAALERALPALRRELAAGQYAWAATRGQEAPPPRSGGAAFFRRMLELAEAGCGDELLDAGGAHIWAAHLERNVWCQVGAGVDDALGRLRAAGIRLAVVSNAEGTVEAMLNAVGLGRHLDTVVDSWAVGVAKPDPRIFYLALERLGVDPADAVMLGDTPSSDIDGALGAGVAAILIDPFDLHPGVAVPRVPDVAAFVDALLGRR